jgi:hypothetical protein
MSGNLCEIHQKPGATFRAWIQQTGHSCLSRSTDAGANAEKTRQ